MQTLKILHIQKCRGEDYEELEVEASNKFVLHKNKHPYSKQFSSPSIMQVRQTQD